MESSRLSIPGVFTSALALFSVVVSAGSSAGSSDVYGFGAKVTGGKGAKSGSTYVVKNFEQFKKALDNKGKPHAPKVIYIDGVVDGNYLPSGELATEEAFAQGTTYDWETYLNSFNETLKAELAASSDPADKTYLELLGAQEGQRQKASKAQEKQISLVIGNNTSIEPRKGAKVARIQNSYLAVNSSSNIIFRNLEVHSPIDLFPEWDPTDGSTGNWNSKYDTIGIVTADHILVTQCTFSDGAYPDTAEPVVFGKRIMRHDGMIDITEGSDFVTVSYNKFLDHDKSHLIGNNDADNLGPGDKGHLHVTFYGNWWVNSMQRSPRVRFGQVHVFNNLYQGKDSGEQKVVYFIGMGINSTILSENNVFEIEVTTSKAPQDYIVGNYKGYNFNDIGSTFNGTAVDVDAIAEKKYNTAKAAEVTAAATAGRAVAEWATHVYTNAAFKPPYKYKLQKTKDVKKDVVKKAGQKL